MTWQSQLQASFDSADLSSDALMMSFIAAPNSIPAKLAKISSIPNGPGLKSFGSFNGFGRRAVRRFFAGFELFDFFFAIWFRFPALIVHPF